MVFLDRWSPYPSGRFDRFYCKCQYRFVFKFLSFLAFPFYRYSLPKVQVIGKKVLNKYTHGLRVKWEAQTEQIKPYSALVTNVTDQLLYSTPSLDYCEANDGTGALGTAGRQCDPNKTGPGSCNHLCCARGYNERRRIEERKCNCKFLWCCRVVCSRCLTVNKHYTCR